MIADRLLSDLELLWRDLGAGKPEGVVRAAAMTLIVFTSAAEDSASAAAGIASITRRHPNRAIVVRLSADGGALEGSVVADCWRPFGSREQICSERIELRVSNPSGLSPVLLALAAADLPVILWARDPGALEVAEASALDLRPSRMILNSEALPFPDFRRLRCCAIRVADLAWALAGAERRGIAEAFESPRARESLPAVDSAVIRYAQVNPPASAWYSAAWVRNALGREVPFRFSRAEQAGIELLSGSRTVASALRGSGRSEAELLDEELAIHARDHLFEAALAGAERLQEAR